MDPSHQVRLPRSADDVQVHTAGDEGYLIYLRQLVSDLSRSVGFSDNEIAKIEMAVTEACENVVEHAYAPALQWRWRQPDPEIRIDIHTDGERLIIEINDHGQRFDFAQYNPPDINDQIAKTKGGGYGIAIIRKFMDEVQYNSNDQTGNTLRMVKYLKKS